MIHQTQSEPPWIISCETILIKAEMVSLTRKASFFRENLLDSSNFLVHKLSMDWELPGRQWGSGLSESLLFVRQAWRIGA